jgi:hypothetical protein
LTTVLTEVALPDRRRDDSLVDRIANLQRAEADTWGTEVLSDQISRHLALLAQIIEQPGSNIDKLQAVVRHDVAFAELRPTKLVVQYERHPVIVRRLEKSNGQTVDDDGLTTFAKAIQNLAKRLPQGYVRAKFKLYHIQQHDSEIWTDQFCEIASISESQSVQQTATWRCRWIPDTAASSSLRLARVEVNEYEEVTYSDSAGRLIDCTHSVLGNNASYRTQILPGIPYWMNRMSREFMTQFGHHGIAVGDVNGDDLDDIYVCDAGGLPNRLFVQQPDGTAVDVSEGSGVNILEDSVAALLVDLDNDTDQDLVVATDPLVHFAENVGRGKFQLHAGYFANTDSYSLSAADYDNDRLLDIYVCGYNARKQDPVNRGLPFPLPYHDANNGGRNFLLRNEGNFRFTDATEPVGLDENNTRFSLAAAWEDFDNDGDLDLYVANDFGRNVLYRNDKGRFRDIAADAGVEDQASGMSVAWGDYNRDGWMDLYVSNMFSAAGNRVTFQRRFADGLADTTVSHLQRMARGNTLFANAHDGTFRDVSVSAAVTMGRWAWASRFVDLNNDGWRDLVVANGYVTNDDPDDL